MSRETELLAEIGRLNDEVAAIFDEAGDNLLEKTKYETVTANNKRIEELEGQIVQIRDQQAARKQAQDRDKELSRPGKRLGLGGQGQESADGHEQGNRKESQRPLSASKLVIEDPAFKAWLDGLRNGGTLTSAKFGSSPRVTLPGSLKALITGASDTSGGAWLQNDFIGLQAPYGYQRPLTIRDLVTTGTTSSDAVDYARESTTTNNAAPVAEATDVSGSTGVKPQSDLTFTRETTPVKTIAHWVAATRRALADAGQLRMYIDQFLRYGLDEELEDQILTGSGAGENFTGILNTTGTQTQAYDTNLLTTTRKARTLVRTVGRATPTGYVFHPNDWEDIDLLQDNEGRYYYGGPSIIGMPRLWGLPVVESEGMTEGVSVVADWRRAVLLDREQVQILVSDSHSDFFVRNLIAILAELRAAFFVVRPSAFVEIDLTA